MLEIDEDLQPGSLPGGYCSARDCERVLVAGIAGAAVLRGIRPPADRPPLLSRRAS
jgi:hypothetical protein